MLNILGIDVDNDLKMESAVDKFDDFLSSNQQNYIVTPNPEIILQAQKDEELFYILNRANLSLADGFGLKIAAFLMNRRLSRVSGSDILPELLCLAERRGKKVLIINREDGLSSAGDIKIFLNNNYPSLKFFIQDADHKYIVPPRRHLLSFKDLKDENFVSKFVNNIKEKINKNFHFLNKNELLDFEADVMICNFGAPYQEKFIFHNLNKIPTLKLAIGLGGSFDFLTGKIKRAPRIFRFLGLEWLWRLFKQPKRYKRMFNAVVVFLTKFFYWNFFSHFFYRKNVACLLYRKSELPYTALDKKKMNNLDDYQILLVERSEEKDHWQIPQGGLDNQNIKLAGSRELYEELGIRNFSPRKVYKNVFKYKTNHRGRYGFKGQSQSLLLAEFHGADTDIEINFWDHSDFKWVKASEFVRSVYHSRQAASQIFFDKFKEYLNN
ncbi:hypothetical protein CVU82_02110 [Candidatus Falkowbacteria bacterium HGW-Falkowbacteria-1]|uniref:Nudix hydrolase domain-containing protein n=1 Tax=Candidatus Falkowbacteria bacterium HGW-Falkowbacteria-1 TaxID=2013768 RepID=A0A2N2E9L7_9BACT|nr:MAG: hypothetical protein CVU82_02110 [Candidatus Falkowbacteria bacterium HGW-Falkowbacteria-1]